MATGVMLASAGLGLQLLAGEYYRGDGLGLSVKLSLRSDAGFSFSCGGHLGEVLAVEGQARLEGSSLLLEPTTPILPAEAWHFSRRLVVVPWAERVYLVPEEEGVRFAAHVTRGREPRTKVYGWFLLKRPDWEKATSGLPEVPAAWQRWFLQKSVDARITRALARHRAEIGAGSKQGLTPGILLGLVSKKYGPSDVRVVSVTADSSIIENDHGDPPLLVGWRVTSRAP
jgi:hypothetical protein